MKKEKVTTGMHFDNAEGFLFHRRGRKRVMLWSPEQMGSVMHMDATAFCNAFPVDPFSQDEMCSHYADFYCTSKPVEATLEAGDMLYIPWGWAHYVLQENLGEGTLSIDIRSAMRDLSKLNLDVETKFLQHTKRWEKLGRDICHRYEHQHSLSNIACDSPHSWSSNDMPALVEHSTNRQRQCTIKTQVHRRDCDRTARAMNKMVPTSTSTTPSSSVTIERLGKYIFQAELPALNEQYRITAQPEEQGVAIQVKATHKHTGAPLHSVMLVAVLRIISQASPDVTRATVGAVLHQQADGLFIANVTLPEESACGAVGDCVALTECATFTLACSPPHCCVLIGCGYGGPQHSQRGA